MRQMYEQYGFYDVVKAMSPERLFQFLRFRANFLKEELTELEDNIRNPEEIVDALVDLTVVAIGTLDLFEVDVNKAWKEVLRANLQKKVGEKVTRPNEFGFPDLVKPDGWVKPSHAGNYGLFEKLV